ncbi:MAG: hypothetical protein QM234_08555 [Acidobacteriota bacterium]|nr:hypothetical protein [Acidobacteriota bacterium]
MSVVTKLDRWATSGRKITRRKNANWVRLAYGTWAELEPGEPWQIWESVQTQRARSVLAMSAEGTALDGIIAALIHGAPVPKQSWTIELITGVKHSRHHSRCKVRAIGSMVAFITNAFGQIRQQNSSASRASTAPNSPSTIKNKPLPQIREATVRRSSRTFPPEAFTTINGMRVLRWDYLCVELLARHPARDAIPIVDWFINEQVKKFERDRPSVEASFRAILLRLEGILSGRKDSRGRRRARQNLQLVSPWAESPGESLMRLELYSSGFPPPTEQYEIVVAGRRYFADFAYPGKKLALEFDGLTKYGDSRESSQQALVKERDRERAIRKVLPSIERFTWQEFQSGSMRARLRQLKEFHFGRSHPGRGLV